MHLCCIKIQIVVGAGCRGREWSGICFKAKGEKEMFDRMENKALKSN